MAATSYIRRCVDGDTRGNFSEKVNKVEGSL